MWPNTATWLDHTVQCGGTWLAYAVHQTFPKVGQACDTRKQYASILTSSIEQFLLLKFRIPKSTNTHLQAHIQNFVCTLRLASFSGLACSSLAVRNSRTRPGSSYHSPTPERKHAHTGKAWYLFSRSHDVIETGPQLLEQKSSNLHVVQQTLRSTLGMYSPPDS